MPLLQTTISGVLYDVAGNVAPNIAVWIHRVTKSGVTIQYKRKKAATSDAAGLVSFTVPRNSTAWISGNFFIGATRFQVSAGVSIAIPDAATATLESLGAASTVPTQGLTLKSNGTSLANLIGTLDFSTAFTVTESPTGEANVDLAASLIVTTEQVQDALATFFPDAAPYDWTYDDALNKVGLIIASFTGDSGAGGVTGLVPAPAAGDAAANKFLKSDGSWTAVAAGSAWGGITGTLSSQTDLQNALNAKANLVSPSFTTPSLDVATAISINKVALTQPATAATLTILNNKTLTVNKSLTLEGTDSTVMTFPTTSATIARVDAGNAFIGNQSIAVGQTTSAQTDLLINPTTKASGNLFQAAVNSVNKFSVDFNGTTITGGSITSGGSLTLGSTANVVSWPSSSRLLGPADGTIRAQNAAGTGFNVLALGGTSPATIGAAPTQGQVFSILQATELLTIAAAATTNSAMSLPAGAIILAISARVTTVIPTAATFSVKVGAVTFSTVAISTAANTTDPGTAAGASYLAASTPITVTPNLTPATGTGVVRLTAVYMICTPPTS